MRTLIMYFVAFTFLASCKSKLHIRDNATFGIDVSNCQGTINWQKVASQDKHKITFVIIRATAGTRKDLSFEKNFSEAKEHGFIVGTYHYYDPNENSTQQAKNYLESIQIIGPGDMVPVIDIEKYSRVQDNKKLVRGIKNFLSIVEKKYKVKPIIYTGLAFYRDYLSNHSFDTYPLWIAAYSKDKRDHPIVKRAAIHQFSEKVKVPGISENTVDGNDILIDSISSLCLK